jgi:hypothetical protein
MRQLADTARQRGMTRTGWIVALVRSRLGSPVQHSLEELAAPLSSSELNRIGGNINQMRAPQIPACCRAGWLSLISQRSAMPNRDRLGTRAMRGALAGNADYWETRR